MRHMGTKSLTSQNVFDFEFNITFCTAHPVFKLLGETSNQYHVSVQCHGQVAMPSWFKKTI